MSTSAGPLISVIIPTYNQANFLDMALQSVIKQSYDHLEIIIIDNTSTDNTDEILEKIIDQRVTIHKIVNNGVIAKSRNAGIAASRGEWIAFLDSDDLWYPERIDLIVNAIKNSPTIDIFSTDELLVNRIHGRKKSLKYGLKKISDIYENLLTVGNFLSPSATVVKKDFLDRSGVLFDESQNYITAEDYNFWLDLAKNRAKFQFLNRVLGEYIVHGSNNSSRENVHETARLCVIEKHIYAQDLPKNKLDKKYKKIETRILMLSSLKYLCSGDFLGAIDKACSAIRISIYYSILGIIYEIYVKVYIRH